ncbi:MAG: alanine:cation symporter family protein [Candidatus Babeliaceae bacterium]
MAFSLTALVYFLEQWIWGWPLVIFMISSAIFMTIALKAIQFRYFFESWKYVFFPEKIHGSQEKFISPFQAFVNTLSASIGNGSTAGMATALYAGGPGAAFWIFILGFFNMALRFVEVYASTRFVDISGSGFLRGGPMVFLQKVPGRKFLPALYASFCLYVSFVAGSAVQCNSMRIGIERLTALNPFLIATLLATIVLYGMLGGARRIIIWSEIIIPFKVGLFFVVTGFVLFSHYHALINALKIIIESAFYPQAVAGALAGHSIKNALRFGISRSASATEAGLGTAGILFGSTGTKHPFKTALMSMTSIFISNHLVCCSLLLLFVASGVWNSGLTSTAMLCAAYETTFGTMGCLIATFLSIIFGIGVLIAYAYIGRECWMFLFKGRFLFLYTALYCALAFIGALSHVEVIWSAVDIGNAGMIIINVYGLLVLLPKIRKEVV